RTGERTGEDRKQNGAPAEERADAGEKFQIAATHGFARNDELARGAGNFGDVIELEGAAFDRDAIVVKLERDFVVNVVVDLRVIALEQQPVALAREMVAPQTLLRPH